LLSNISDNRVDIDFPKRISFYCDYYTPFYPPFGCSICISMDILFFLWGLFEQGANVDPQLTCTEYIVIVFFPRIRCNHAFSRMLCQSFFLECVAIINRYQHDYQRYWKATMYHFQIKCICGYHFELLSGSGY
jgi:hypothetical protein